MRMQLETIASKISAGMSDREIITELKIKEPTYWNYKSRITVLYGDLGMKKTEETLQLEVELCKERFLKIYRNLEERIFDKDEELNDVAYASEIAAGIATNILRLEVEGLKARQQRGFNVIEQKAIRYIGDIQSDKPEESTVTNDILSTAKPSCCGEEPIEDKSVSPGGFEEKVF